MTIIEILKALDERYKDMDGDRELFGHDYTEGYLDGLAFVEAMLTEEYGQG